jgi:chromosome segregation ATPase
MADDLDQLSRLLGRIEADMAEGARQRDALFKKLDNIETIMHEQNGAAKLLAAQVAELAKDQIDLVKRIDEQISPAVEDFKSLKNKGLGVIAFIGLASSGGGAFLVKWLGGQ